ncbi:hypothetical protein NM688_g6725 [Phlebia brevispora]|uniref:Uncharacterized protein n=1 Tax=Phlebia brevispora TaxID=194682 RepID=A0ACC1SD31_9APHY|nr:hypothetical protein NM688_g6725 [Phlebia brevispora]
MLQYVPTHTLPGHHGAAITAVSVNTDGTLLASCDTGGGIYIWSLPAGMIVQRIKASSAVLSMKWFPSNSAKMIAGTGDGTLITVELDQHAGQVNTRGIDAHGRKAIETLALRAPKQLVHETSSHLLASAGRDIIRVWAAHEGRGNTARPVMVASVNWMKEVDELLASFIYHGVVCWRWNSATNAYAATWSIYMDLCGPCLPYPCGTRLAVCNIATGFDVYQIPSGLREVALEPMEDVGIVIPIVFAHKHNLLVSGSRVGKIRIWDASTLQHLQTVRIDGSPIVQAVTTHQSFADASMIIIGTSELDGLNTIQIWETKDTGVSN